MDEKRHNTLYLLHGRLREIVGGRLRFCVYGVESDAPDQKQAGIVADFEVWGRREVLERRRPCAAIELRRNCRQLQTRWIGVSRMCAFCRKKEKSRGQT